MRWAVVAVFAYFLLGIELVLPGLLRLGPTIVAPSFVVPFVVFVAMFAPPTRAYWLALVMGLCVDLLTPWEGRTVVPGPHALGLLIAAFLIVTIRSSLNRNTLSLIVFSIIAAALSHLVLVGLMTVRARYTVPTVWDGSEQLVQRLLASLYTGGSAAVLGLALFPCQGLFRFSEPYARRMRSAMR